MIAVSVVDAANRPASQVGVSTATLVDDQGRSYGMAMGESFPNDPSSAANLLWFRAGQPLGAGPRTFHMRFDTIDVRDQSTPPPTDDPSWNPWHGVAGPWAFDFELTVRPGSLVRPDATAAAAGLTVRLREVSATEATIRANVEVLGASNTPGASWMAVGAFEHDGAQFAIDQGTAMADGVLGIEAIHSTARRSGEWVLRVDELVGLDEAGQQVRLQGPWRLQFTLP